MTNQQRAQEVLARARAIRPSLWPLWAYVADIDPDWVDVGNEQYRHLLTRDGALPLKTKEMIVSVLLAARAFERTATHLNQALEAGATEAELLEALEVAQMITGAPTFIFGVEALSKVVAKRKAGSS